MAVSSLLGTLLSEEWTGCFAKFGLLVASYYSVKLIISLLSGIRTFLLASPMDLKSLGEWAVVTGATDGIGKAYAQQLSKLGLKVLLISRTQKKLDDVAQEISSETKGTVDTLAIDFTGGPEIYDRLRQHLSSMDIAILVNNVGTSVAYPDYLVNIDPKDIRGIINVNIFSCTELCHIVLPNMIKKRKGVIVNIASASGARPTPLLTVYSATKVYMDFFSRALQTEVKNNGIIVQSVLPYFVATKLSGIRRESFIVPGPTTYVRQALLTIGREQRTFGCLSHSIQNYITSMIPEFIANPITIKVLSSAKARYLRRAKKE